MGDYSNDVAVGKHITLHSDGNISSDNY